MTAYKIVRPVIQKLSQVAQFARTQISLVPSVGNPGLETDNAPTRDNAGSPSLQRGQQFRRQQGLQKKVPPKINVPKLGVQRA
jgi:hypothetical protein